jgi:hypothetical protein
MRKGLPFFMPGITSKTGLTLRKDFAQGAACNVRVDAFFIGPSETMVGGTGLEPATTALQEHSIGKNGRFQGVFSGQKWC